MSNWGSHLQRASYMGFNWLYVNPLGFPGFSGSIYSIKDYYRMNPLFLDSSGRTEEEQLIQMIERAHGYDLKVMFDLVINHTAIDSVLVKRHPDWYKRHEDGSLKNPEVWEGDKRVAVWGDLAEINNDEADDQSALWHYWEQLIQYYMGLGVDGFRCDAAYQVPSDLWKYLISRAKEERSDVLFFAETLGCETEDVIELAGAGFDLTFNSSKWWDFKEAWCLKQYRENMGLAPTVSFAESHDTPRLAEEFAGDEAAIKQRILFSTIFSTSVMMSLGVEFGFRRQVNVVKTLPRHWEPVQLDLVEFVRKVNALKADRLFSQDNDIRQIDVGNPAIIALLKTEHDGQSKALILLNTHRRKHEHVALNLSETLGFSLNRIQDRSVEYALADLPTILDYHMRPSQVMLFVGR